jgi:hypothetical protein
MPPKIRRIHSEISKHYPKTSPTYSSPQDGRMGVHSEVAKEDKSTAAKATPKWLKKMGVHCLFLRALSVIIIARMASQ